MPRIGSALPAEPTDPDADGEFDALPRARQVLLFVTIAVLLVIGVALLIMHSWDVETRSTRATVGADTSKAGFPGEIEALTSQDRSALSTDSEVGEPVASADETTYDVLHETWEAYATLEASLSESEELLRAAALGSVSNDTLSDAVEQSRAVALDVSNVIATAQAADVSSGTYVLARDHMVTLGNWLRNWSDVLEQAWGLVEGAGLEVDEHMLSGLDAATGKGGRNAYRVLFDERYEEWEPDEPATQ